MFSKHDFIMKTLKGMVGVYPDCQVRKYALKWEEEKGELTLEDLAEIDSAIEAQYTVKVEVAENEENLY